MSGIASFQPEETGGEPPVPSEAAQRGAGLHDQLEELMDEVWELEAEWRFDDMLRMRR